MNLASTLIQAKPRVYVSTACVAMESLCYSGIHRYVQVETWVFSDDPKLRSWQRVYEPSQQRLGYVLRAHDHIVGNVRRQLKLEGEDDE